MENQKLNDQLKRLLHLNKCLQNETYRLTEKMASTEINSENSLMFKSYMDAVQHTVDDLQAITYQIRVTLHETKPSK